MNKMKLSRSEYVANLSLEASRVRAVVTTAHKLAERMAGDLTLAPDHFDPAAPFGKPAAGKNWPGR